MPVAKCGENIQKTRENSGDIFDINVLYHIFDVEALALTLKEGEE